MLLKCNPFYKMHERVQTKYDVSRMVKKAAAPFMIARQIIIIERHQLARYNCLISVDHSNIWENLMSESLLPNGCLYLMLVSHATNRCAWGSLPTSSSVSGALNVCRKFADWMNELVLVSFCQWMWQTIKVDINQYMLWGLLINHLQYMHTHAHTCLPMKMSGSSA